MDVFTQDCYKKMVLTWIEMQERGGHGQLRRIAKYLGVGSTYMSQVFRADRHLSVDQALNLSSYMGLTQLETDYFILLVQQARAATQDLKDYYQLKMQLIARSSKNLKDRLDADIELTEIEKARFYSDWTYSAIRNLIAIPGYGSIPHIAARLKLPHVVVQEALDFLLQTGLCELSQGKLTVGHRITHLEASSAYVKTRQMQWRMKAIQSMDISGPDALFYTCPMSLSKKTRTQIRETLLQTIQKIIDEVKPSPSEELMCLNIDWFSV